MAFQFPDPSVTPEFTGANGITYSWDATDGKWVVKGFAAESVIGPCASSSNTICDQLTELEEEIDALAPSVERGFWTMNLLGTVANQGQMSLYDDNYTNVGNPTGLFKDAKSIWLNELDNDGTPHGFNNVEAGELIELFVQGQSEYGLYEVVDVHDETNGAAQWWVIEVNFVRTLEDTSTADNGDLIRVKIFQAPSGGNAGDFVKRSGDTMTGALAVDAKDDTTDGESMFSIKGDQAYGGAGDNLLTARRHSTNGDQIRYYGPITFNKEVTTKEYVDNLIRVAGLELGRFTYRRSGDSFFGGHIKSDTTTNPLNITTLKIHKNNADGIEFGTKLYEDIIREKMWLHFRDKGTANYVGKITGIEMLSSSVKLTLNTMQNGETYGTIYVDSSYEVSIGYNRYGRAFPSP